MMVQPDRRLRDRRGAFVKDAAVVPRPASRPHPPPHASVIILRRPAVSDLTLNAETRTAVRQGRRPQDPSRPPDPRGHVRPRHRPRAHHAARPRDHARAEEPQRAAHDRASTARSSWRWPRTCSATRSSRSSSTSTCVVVRKGEKVKVDVPVHVVGEAAPDTMVPWSSRRSSSRSRPPPSPRRSRSSVEGLRRPARRSTPPTSRCLRARRWSPTPRLSSSTSTHGVTSEALGGRARRGRGRGRHRARGADRAGRGRRGSRRRGVTGPGRSRSDPTAGTLAGRRARQPRARRTPGNRHNVGAMVLDVLGRRVGGQLQARTRLARLCSRVGSACCPAVRPARAWCSPSPRRT